jgi:hypothetical protein
MRYIPRDDDQVELERKVVCKLALIVRDYDVVGTELLDVLRFMRGGGGGGGGGEGIDLGVDDVGRENFLVTLSTSKVSILML